MAVLDDKIAETPLARRDLAEDLARVPLFAALDPATLRAVAAGMDWFSLPGGATLFEAGESRIPSMSC